MNAAVINERIDQDGAADLGEINTQVQSLLHGRVGDLSLLVYGKGIIMRGHARSYYTKQIAQHAVMKVTDLPILRNEIEVT